MGYRGCIEAQVVLAVAVHFMKKALGEIVETGSYTGLDDAEFTALRKEIEDLIGLDAYYRIEAETVEPGSQAGLKPPLGPSSCRAGRGATPFQVRHAVLSSGAHPRSGVPP